MVIHSFGDYLNLAATWFVSKGAAGRRDGKSIYNSNLFSMAEPSSFRAVDIVPGCSGRHGRAVCQTRWSLSLCSSTLSFATVSKFLEGKFSVVHMQNGTLAGGVVMKVCGDMKMRRHGAMAAGLFSSLQGST